MKKILIVITKGEIGGAQKIVLNLAKGFKEKGIEVVVGFGKNGDFLKNQLTKEKIRWIEFQYLKKTLNPLINLLFIFELKNFLDKEKFDLLHLNSTNSLFGAIAGKISKSKPKTIFVFHGLSVLDPNFRARKILKLIYYLIFKLLLIFVDEKIFVAEENLKTALKIKLVSKGKVIPNGIERIDFFSPSFARDFFEKEIKKNLENKIIIGSIGRLVWAKNYQFLINSAELLTKKFSNLVFLIIGDGEERKELEKLIEEKNLKNNFFLLGEIEEASRYLKGFDFFVLTSNYEGAPVSLIEALQAGLITVAPKVGGIEEILNSAGKCYQPNNQKEFIEIFSELIENKKIQKKLSQLALQRSKLFSSAKMISGYLSIID